MTSSRRELMKGAGAGAALALAGPLAAQGRPGIPGRSLSVPYPVYGKVERYHPALDALVDVDARVELLVDGFNWIEGPAWIGGTDGYLLTSHPRDNQITRWSARDGSSVWLTPSGYDGPPDRGLREAGANGLWADAGELLLADSGQRCIRRVDLRTKARTILIERFEGKRFNSPNDIAVSPRDGAIFFTDPTWGLASGKASPLREMDYTGVFRLGRDGRLSLVGKYDQPNGIGVSPDGGTLYVTDAARGWVAMDLDASGRASRERDFLPLSKLTSPDGFKLDAAGNMWTGSKDGIAMVSPSGLVLGLVRCREVAANCVLAADGHLYIASDRQLARVKVKARRLTTRWS